MTSLLRQPRTVHMAFSAIAAAVLLAGCSGPFAGNLLSGWTDAQMLTLFDTDGDGTTSTRELRKGLSKIIVKVASQDAQYDLNGDGQVTRADIKAGAMFIRGVLQASCGNGREDVSEECDDGNMVSGDGCSGANYPNGACLIEHCGDAYVDTDGVPDPRGNGGLMMPAEQCDDGGTCVGGVNDGKPCTSFGGFVGDRQCPGGSCGMFSFDGCQSNCLLEICGNGTWEGKGLDGKPGKAGIDDDVNGTTDDDTELWTIGSDDEECDQGGACMKNGAPLEGYNCTAQGSDECRRNGGICVAEAKGNCSNQCALVSFLNIANGSTQPDNTAMSVGAAKTIGAFKVTQDAGGYVLDIRDLIVTISAKNVSLKTSSMTLGGVSSELQCTVHAKSDGSIVTTDSATGDLYLKCTFPEEKVRMNAGTELLITVKADILSTQLDSTQSSSLQATLENIATSEKMLAFGKSHIRWIVRNGGMNIQKFRVKNDVNVVGSTLYGSLPSQCGDGVCQPSENATLCVADCVVCGNGTREAAEQCDDGNVVGGDKCSQTCTGVILLDYVKSIADTNNDGTVSDGEALAVTFDILDADTQPYQDVKRYDVDDPDGNTFIDGDGDVDDTDVSAIIGALDTLAP